MRAKGKDPVEIAAKRRRQRRRVADTPDYDPTKVARQSTTRPAGSRPAGSRPAGASQATTTASPTSPAEGTEGDRTVVARQQPRRNTRAQRKS